MHAGKMDDSSSQKKTRTLDAVIAAVNLAAMGSAIGSSRSSADAHSEIAKKIDELGARIEQLASQVKALQAPQQEQKMVVDHAGSPEAEKKPDAVQQAKAQDVIYVRKATEFSFYS
jgi:hypothetical protein